jgi:hypothetical protein
MNQTNLCHTTVAVKNPHFSANILPDGSWVLHNNESNEVVVLNATAGILWELCSGEYNIGEIILQLMQYYPDKSADSIEKDLYTITPTLLDKHAIFIQ